MPVKIGRKILRSLEIEQKMIILRVPEKLYKKLDTVATIESKSLNWTCRDLLNSALDRHTSSGKLGVREG